MEYVMAAAPGSSPPMLMVALPSLSRVISSVATDSIMGDDVFTLSVLPADALAGFTSTVSVPLPP